MSLLRTMYRCLLLMVILLDLVSGLQIIKNFLEESTGRCNKESVSDSSYYITYIGIYTILRKCRYGMMYSTFFCDCVPVPSPILQELSQVDNIAVLGSSDDDENFCRPYIKFVFDRTFLSEDGSTPSQPVNFVQFAVIPGATGQSAAYFNGNGSLTVWSMTYITFASKFKFSIRFKLQSDYEYEDKFYNLFGDEPCSSNPPRYSFAVNPARNEVHAFIYLRNKNSVDLLLTDVDLRDWTEVTLKAVDGEVKLSADDVETTESIGLSTIKSSPCPLEIGHSSVYGDGFVGYIDKIVFYNCF